jgi:hypothetical protein
MREFPRCVLVLAMVALGGIASLAVAPAMATTATKVQSTVTITSGKGSEFTGKVNSAKKKCRVGRTVKLFREAGSSRMGDPVVGTAKTDASGAWTMDGSFLAGVYYAQVVAVLVHYHGMSFQCRGDFSIRAHF